jgi:CrcB protein
VNGLPDEPNDCDARRATDATPQPGRSPKPPPLAGAIIAGAGGALGTLLRALTRQEFITHLMPAWVATLSVNVVATFIAGFCGRFLLGHLTRRQALDTDVLDPAQERAHRLGMLWITGFCGGLSTFSAFGVDMVGLSAAGHFGEIMLNTALSLGLGLPSAMAGLALGWRMNPHRDRSAR